MRTSSTPHASASLTSDAAEAVAFAERLIADAKSGAFRGLAFAYVCEQGTATYVARAVWFDRSDLKTGFLLGSEIYDLAGVEQILGQTAAPDALPPASRAN
jgi:hypothetical protein